MITWLKTYWHLAVIVVMAAVIAVLLLWMWYRPEPKPQVQYQQIETIREVEKIKRVEVPIEKIVVIEKDALDKELDPAPAILNNPALQAIAVGVVQPYDGETRVVAIVDTGTGEGRIEGQRLPRDWFEFKNEWFVGGGYNLLDTSNPWRVDVGWSPLRTGCMEWSAEAMLTSGYQFAGVMGRCRF